MGDQLFSVTATTTTADLRTTGKARIEVEVGGVLYRCQIYRHPESGGWRANYWSQSTPGGLLGELCFTDAVAPAEVRFNPEAFWAAVAAAFTARDAVANTPTPPGA